MKRRGCERVLGASMRLRLGRAHTIAVMSSLCAIGPSLQAETFNFSAQLFGPPSTLGLWTVSQDAETGDVVINGGDSQGPTTPFTWDWGDGQIMQGFFPQQHTYADNARNYVIKVTAHYSDGGEGHAELILYFVAPHVNPVSLPAAYVVTIPDTDVVLGTRLYTPPVLSHFDDAHFGAASRATVEYVLSAVAAVQADLVNDNVADVGGGFEQVVLRDPGLGGAAMYSLWFTTPVSFAAGDAAVAGSVEYQSLMHEMGHNFTLNTPADFYYGGRIDGASNAIYSETMAQIMQHATAYEIINHADRFGLGEDIVADIRNHVIGAMYVVRNSYDNYVANGAVYGSWSKPEVDAYGTFMTLAYKFCEHAETSGLGYRVPLRRMMQLLQTFDADLAASFDQNNDTPEADVFRGTLMVAAISYGYQTDLRSEFAALNFPTDDTIYNALIAGVPAQVPEACCLPNYWCVELTMDDCVTQGGNPQGAGTDCLSFPCPVPAGIPAASEWSLTVMTLFTLAAGSVLLRRRGAAQGCFREG